MEKIESFKLDHLTLKSGLYVSRRDSKNGMDTTTFDLRTINPYIDPFMKGAAIHTFEHLGATFFRNGTKSEDVIYFGPMGCKTGFYLVMFGKLEPEDIYEDVLALCEFVINFKGEIPGNKKEECGNYLYHNLELAKEIAKKYKLELTTNKRLKY